MEELTRQAIEEVVARSNFTDAGIAELIRYALVAQMIKDEAEWLDPDEYEESLELSAPTKVRRLPSLLGQTELAQLFGVTSGTIRQWKFRNKLPDPTEIISGTPCWSRFTIEQWINEIRRCA